MSFQERFGLACGEPFESDFAAFDSATSIRLNLLSSVNRVKLVVTGWLNRLDKKFWREQSRIATKGNIKTLLQFIKT
jgi:hypothetical protein